MRGYEEAAKIDELIYKLYEKEPLCLENACEWMAYTRTVVSGLNLIEQKALGLLRKESEKSDGLAKKVDVLLAEEEKVGPVSKGSIDPQKTDPTEKMSIRP